MRSNKNSVSGSASGKEDEKLMKTDFEKAIKGERDGALIRVFDGSVQLEIGIGGHLISFNAGNLLHDRWKIVNHLDLPRRKREERQLEIRTYTELLRNTPN